MRSSQPDVCIEFTHAPSAAGSVRRALLDDLDVDAPLAEDVELVVSELVTNVVRHAGTDGVVELWVCDDAIRIEVHDDDAAPPQMRAAVGADGGFGLRIVDRLASAWGHRSSRDGKTVWAVVETSPSTPP